MPPPKRMRQPKMTTQALLSLDLGESSSSDSDFRIEDHNEDEDDFSDVSKDDDDGNDDSSSSSSADSTQSDDNEDLLADLVGSEDSTQQLRQLLSDDANAVQQQNGNSLEVMLQKLNGGAKAKVEKLPTKPICCVCLGDRSDDANEIIECDGCGVSVHEGCYGVSDNVSISSTNSTCSTEPWFCEACRAGVKDPSCELCPNRGGIFKETDVGKWVHLVCALYIRGVAFGEVDQLSSVTLFEMPYTKWGAKVCALCENARFARTGVCIECDAGMCKAYFHVTCAQAAGFLTEGQNEDEALDPYYAHCKLHSDKDMLKRRKRNYNMLRLLMEQKQKEVMARNESSEAQQRNKRKLAKYQLRYQKHKQLKGNPWVPTQKMSRLLTTSASACKRLLAKAAIVAVDVDLLERQEAQIAALTDIRKKWHIPPAFSVEFIGYYLDRISRSKEIKQQLVGMVGSNMQLNKQQDMLRSNYDMHLEENRKLKIEQDALLAEIAALHKNIQQVAPNKILTNLATIECNATGSFYKGNSETQQVAAIVPVVPPEQELAAEQPKMRAIGVPTAAALKMGVGFPLSQLGNNSTRILSTYAKNANSSPIASELVNNVANCVANNLCGICKLTHDQHLLTKCDTCKLYYHLGCLNPPLTRPPKKSKLYGWQCSECDKSDESDAAPPVPKGPRKSRTRFNKDGSIQLAEKSTDDEVVLNKKVKDTPLLIADTVVVNANAPVIADLRDEKSLELNMTSESLVINNPLPAKDTSLDVSKAARKQKRREKHKNKHNLSSDGSDNTLNKEHKRKRKKKQHDHEHHHHNTSTDMTSDTGIVDVPKIKIKFKTLPLPGEDTPEAQFFYVPADMVRSAEEGSRCTSVETVEEPNRVLLSTSEITFNSSTSSPVKSASKPVVRRGRKKVGRGKYPRFKAQLQGGQATAQAVTPQPLTPKPQKPQLVLNCCVCADIGYNTNMVTCDECKKCYHFTCLDPPLKKSPKIRGYSWHCADCDPTEDERK